MDVLSDILSSLRLTGGVIVDGELTGEFSLDAQFTPEECAPFFPMPETLIGYHYIRCGSAIVRVEGMEPVAVSTGDIAILPRNHPHVLASDTGRPSAPPNEMELLTARGVHRISAGTPGPATRIWCGVLGTARTNAHAILEALPPLLVLKTRDRERAWLDSSLGFLAEDQPSPDALARIAELFVAQAIRDYVQNLPEGSRGWLRGLADPAVSRALSVIHKRYAEDLNVDELSREAGVSRTVLGERFAELLGEPPMRYCAKWRMRMAANMLRDGRENSANIAYSVGFNSEAAFNRAFKREFGDPPATWRRRLDAEENDKSPAVPVDEIRYCTSSDGTAVAYAVSGEGFPMVKAPTCFTHLAHDWSNPVYSHWLADLSRSNRLVRCDMRGFGLSSRDPGEFSTDALVGDLASVIEASGVERCDLIGLAHGAAIALAYAARHPERVRKLVLVNGFAAGWAMRGDPDEIAWRQSLIQLNRRRWTRDGVALGQRFVSVYFPSAAIDMIDWHKQRFDELGSAENLESMLEWGARIDVRDELKKVKAQALVLHSKDDGNAAVEVGREVADSIEGSRFIELDSANHLILGDEPAWRVLTREMRSFLAA